VTAGMNALDRLIANLARLPGLGRKSASRIAYFLLKTDETIVRALADDLSRLRQTIRTCSVCGTYTEADPCGICTDPHRDRSIICVVEEPRDVLTIEGIHEHRGLYHVLMGAISPIDGIGPDKLRIAPLVERVRTGGVTEVILATNPTVEGETTALYLVKALKETGVQLSRIAFGLPVGGDLEFADRQTLARSFKGRNPF
jgi:recombination protein RecR